MILGISGKKQAGKDTVCKIIQYLMTKEANKNTHVNLKTIEDAFTINSNFLSTYSGWQRKLFADKVKDIVCMLIGCTREQLEDNDFKETPLGEEWTRWLVHDYDPEGYTVTIFNTKKEAEFSLTNEGKNWLANNPKIEEQKLTPRLLLQLIGTECGRNIIHPNIWVNALMSEYKPLMSAKMMMIDFAKNEKWEQVGESIPIEWPNWIVTDVRFPNEAQAIKDKGGIVIRIERPCPKCGRSNSEGKHFAVCDVKQDTHESETALNNYDGFSATINNHSDIENLIVNVKAVLQIFNLIK